MGLLKTAVCLTALIVAVGLVSVRGATDQCKGRCFDAYNSSLPCQCTSNCQDYSDCCSDFTTYCSSGNNSCAPRCGIYDPTKACACDATCRNYGNCCPDFMTYCGGLLNGTCQGRCNMPYDPTQVCQCSSSCTSYGDCCPDFLTVCSTSSCLNRCGTPYDSNSPCQCNAECVLFGYCCPDAATECASGATDAELQTLTQQMWDADVDRLAVTLDLQAVTQDGSTVDNAPGPLCSVIPPEINTLPIYTTLQALFNNYQVDESVVETTDATEDAEINAFLNEVVASQPMILTKNFLVSKGFITSDPTQFLATLKSIWFSFYNRQDVLSSSGFEDVFVGETQTLTGYLDGLNNWVRYCTLEQAGYMNYLGYSKSLDYGGGYLVRHPYYCTVNFQAVGERLFGPSPAFDMAIYTLCYYARANGLCNLAVNSQPLPVQVYVTQFNNQAYVGAGHPAY